MRNLLVAIDFSETTTAVVAQAELLAEATKSKLWLIHIASPDPDFIGYKTGPQTERNFLARKFHNQHRQLQESAQKLRQKGIDAVALMIQGPTVETILEQAHKLAADLIVVGSHGHRGLYKVLVGSVSEGILRQADCPVLIVPARPKLEVID
ncbi:MAG: universal stress protein [Symploca sp. SIO3C6]|uniref:Universal stress protein n=1 Tax=Symploca sp. SIO1C4 TaxID=2607765 RepID=A0A6B3N4S2_9CYAN|nr:universal stress protein [Symploca sp. SIO3C6]NER28696.1 universal stress protein [Symploca sp. SIO1C4]NET06712.1 universal stress protein [Symploca sp. SIO2B6]